MPLRLTPLWAQLQATLYKSQRFCGAGTQGESGSWVHMYKAQGGKAVPAGTQSHDGTCVVYVSRRHPEHRAKPCVTKMCVPDPGDPGEHCCAVNTFNRCQRSLAGLCKKRCLISVHGFDMPPPASPSLYNTQHVKHKARLPATVDHAAQQTLVADHPQAQTGVEATPLNNSPTANKHKAELSS